MAEKIIEFRHVSMSFDGKNVLNDINLYVNKGEFITLLGPSGCGNTTLLRMIAGFLEPDEGELLLDGKPLAGIPPHERPLNTVFQRYALLPHLDVYDNIAFGLKLKKVPQDEIDKRVRRVLKLVAMSDYEDRDVETLSGGQQQRVAIARALVNYPKV
ncbi:MAG: ATP-binding cassette domain-containing protein, partial [Bacteroidales bacterium]|nr:ATP-binding cassette domain-containing protein [Bacteroidales bacterium]